jgi:hypothetical protein
MGATYAVIPAYESDLFGSKYLASNHGRMLLASTGAGKYKFDIKLKLSGVLK